MLQKFSSSKIYGFTLIELMIVVAIIGILSAIAIPAYQGYIRRSYLSEANSSIAAIKSAEESYFTINSCYIEAPAYPSTIPSNSQVAWDSPPTAWGNTGLGVRPDRNVRFQYEVYATNSLGCAAPANDVSEVNSQLSSCITNAVGSPSSFVSTTFFPDNWYIVVARGNLDGDDSVNSIILSAIDDSTVVMCNELK